ncbi:MAG: hypothetical protein K2P78_09755 [Gemmataceae bacterium]|nr:hypothetical protein [Gemmataceae bacterium]
MHRTTGGNSNTLKVGMHVTRVLIMVMGACRYTSCLAGSASTGFGSDGSENAVQAATDRNKSAVESIHTLYCRYTRERYDGAGKLIEKHPEVQYWRAGTSFRSKWRDGKKWCDTVVIGLNMRSASDVSETDRRAGVIAPYTGLPNPEGDPWLDTNVAFIGDVKKNPSPITLAEIVRVPGVTNSARADTLDGKPHTVVTCISPKGTSRGEYWLDHTANYMVGLTVITVTSAKGEDETRTRVDRFVEPTPGVFYPARVTRVRTSGGRSVSRDVGVASEVKINAGLPADIFSLEFKPKDHVNDLVDGKSYTVGADGTSKENVQPVLPLPPPVTAASREVQELTETKAEPRSVRVWLLPASVSLIVLGVVLALVRRHRARTASHSRPQGQRI